LLLLLFLLSDFEPRYLLAVDADSGKEVLYVEVGVAAVAKPWPVGSPHNCRETRVDRSVAVGSQWRLRL
jgi:hypothetical protein